MTVSKGVALSRSICLPHLTHHCQMSVACSPDVLKNMQTDDFEQKKLVCLHLMNYVKTQPELIILAVNTFVKDSEDAKF